jgi:deazaflavin-dependent oxidoreductase (nitroreductase family)
LKKDTPEQARARDERYRIRARDHVARYLATDGKEGYDDNSLGARNLLLTTTGRRSGREYTTALNFAETDGRYVVIASYEGSDSHPKWYLNLEANPLVTVQIRDDRFQAGARTADAEEKKRLWPLLADRLSYFNDYQASTERDIPLIVLERRP